MDSEEDSDYQPDTELEEEECEEFHELPPKKVADSRRQRFIGSLKSSRKHQPSSEEQRCLELFYYIKEPIKKKQLVATIKNSGIQIDEETLNHIYNKVKFACNEYLKTSMG